MFADSAAGRVTITPASTPTAATKRYTGGVLNGVFVLNNGTDAPWYWNGSGVLQAIPSWQSGVTAKSLRPFMNYLVSIGVNKSGTDYDHMVKWSAAAQPGALPTSFDQTDVTKDAGELDLGQDSSLMVDQLPLGNTNIIYKEGSMWSMTYIGQPYIFQFQKLPGSTGMLSVGCAAETPMGHVVLTPGDVILHNGQGPQSIINAVMRRWLFNQIDSTNRALCFVTTNPAANEVWICFPELGKTTCTKAVVWNWADGTWAIRALNNVNYGAVGQIDYSLTSTWEAQTDTWANAVNAWNQDPLSPAQSRLLLASTAPKISAVDVGATMNGAAYTSRLTRTGMSFDKPDTNKLIRAVYPRVEAAKGTQIQIEVGGQMDMESVVTWSPPVTYTVGSSYKADAFASGRFLAMRFTSLDNQPWRIRSIDLDIVERGTY